MEMEFERGDPVEICGRQEGFEGSYYEATIISRIGGGEYIVEYRSLLEDDKMAPLREIVGAGDLRPRQPEVKVIEFRPRDAVDAWDNDGWWHGRVERRWRQNNRYRVYFESSDERKIYGLPELRVHCNWVDGHWSSPIPVKVSNFN